MVLWGLIVLYLIFAAVFLSRKNNNLVCTGIKITIVDSLSNRFVTENELKKMFLDTYPDLVGSSIKEMEFRAMEETVQTHPAIQICHIFSNPKGILNIRILQYEPVVRVFTGSVSYYLDKTGHKIPASNKFNVRSLVVNGSIPNNTDDLMNVANFIKNDTFWDAQIEQIYVKRNNEYILSPRVGDHLILLGTPSNIENKFRNLKAFYKQTNPKTWNQYKVINLKYKDQIVCSRNRLQI